MLDQWRGLLNAYAEARHCVIEAGYWHELEWMGKSSVDTIAEADVLRESAWVILSSGMNYRVVRSKFDAFSKAFRSWRGASTICRNAASCRVAALEVFGHAGKVDAIISIASYLDTFGIEHFKRELSSSGPDFLLQFPFLGPATSRHLAKNLGMVTAKPDRHLVRIANAAGYGSVDELCQIVANLVGESISVVDLVLWRFATLDKNYLRLFHAGQRGVGLAA